MQYIQGDMKRKCRYLLLLLILCLLNMGPAAAKKIHNRQYHFKIRVPATLCKINDTAGGVTGEVYYDSAAGIVFMISDLQGRYRSVDEYIDCTNAELENRIKELYGDPALTLYSCSRSEYYPQKMKSLHFGVSVLPGGFDENIVYFIHHRGKDIQFSFTYRHKASQAGIKYISDIVESLKLK